MPALHPPEPTEWDENGSPIYKFPPFPPPPEGATIIPFAEFEPKGIVLAQDNGVEVDGEGIPTIGLQIIRDEHHERAAQTRKKKKKRKNNPNRVPMRDGRPLMWWEQWQESEEARVVGYIDHGLPMLDRFTKAASEFESGRRMVPDIQSIWDSWRLFVGLYMRNIQAPMTKHAKSMHRSDGDDDDFEPAVCKPDKAANPPATTTHANDVDADVDADADAGEDAEIVLAKEQTKKDDKGDDYVSPYPEDYDPRDLEEHERLIDEEMYMKVERMDYFFARPYFSTKLFLSSHFRDKGLLWSQSKCKNAPVLVEFFFNFLLRNNVLPELDTKLRKCLTVIEKAKKELPATGDIAYALPGRFGSACRDLWGSQVMAGPPLGTAAPAPSFSNIDGESSDPAQAWEKENEIIDYEALEKDISDNIYIDEDGREVYPNPWAANAQLSEDHPDFPNPYVKAQQEALASWVDSGPPASFMTIAGPIPKHLNHSHRPVLYEESVRKIGKAFAVGKFEGHDEVPGVCCVKFLPWDKPEGSIMTETTSKRIPVSATTWDEDTKHPPKADTRDRAIKVLMEPSLANLLIDGMLVDGIYVKLSPRDTMEEGNHNDWWYLEKAIQIWPSYYEEDEQPFFRILTFAPNT